MSNWEELRDEISLELNQVHASLDVLATLAATGDLETLHKHSLTTQLLGLTDKVVEIEKKFGSFAVRQ
jgi:hypothetical protein